MAPDPDFDDPLAELARLVGQEDPFRSLFRGGDASASTTRFTNDHRGLADPLAVPPAPLAEPRLSPERDPVRLQGEDFHEDEAGSDPEDHAAFSDEALHSGLRPTTHDHPDYYRHPADEHRNPSLGYDAAGENEVQDAHEHDHENLIDAAFVQDEAPNFEPHPLTPDIWAQAGHGALADEPEESNSTADTGRATRRPLLVLAAVLILTGGGLAATFLARSSVGSTASGKTAPTIMAAAGPNKVKLADNAASTTAPEDADAALLNKNSNASSSPAKVVNSQEQPIDLGQLPKSLVPVDPNLSQNNPFPQPKKVKTFLVRADGSMISDAPGTMATASLPPAPPPITPPAAAAPPLPAMASGAAAAPEPAVTPSPRPATPKTTTRAATTPKAAPKSISDALNSDQAPSAPNAAPAKPKQSTSPGVHAQSKPKPVEVADAGNATDAVAGAGGSFGVQLVASPNEQDAREAFSRLQRKFPDQLGSLKATIRKAENGDKSVYRVRVSNMSQEEAKTLCSQLQAGGGSCYVVH